MTNEQLAENIDDLRRGQSLLSTLVAKMEGGFEGLKSTLDSINTNLANVGNMREDLATLKERSRAPDPDISKLLVEVADLRGDVKVLKEKEYRSWVESIIKVVGGGGVGGTVAWFFLGRVGG